jgi:hypothetical protein
VAARQSALELSLEPVALRVCSLPSACERSTDKRFGIQNLHGQRSWTGCVAFLGFFCYRSREWKRECRGCGSRICHGVQLKGFTPASSFKCPYSNVLIQMSSFRSLHSEVFVQKSSFQGFQSDLKANNQGRTLSLWLPTPPSPPDGPGPGPGHRRAHHS